MLRNVFTKTLKDGAFSILGWTGGAALMTAGLASMYPFIRDSEAMLDLLADFPPEMMAIFGIDPSTFNTGAGYLSAQMYSFIGPILMIAFAVGLGVAITSRDESDGTMDMLLSMPLARTRLVGLKFVASALMAAAVPVAMAVVLLAANEPIGLQLPVGGIIAINVGLWLLGLVFAAIAAAVGALTGSPSSARGIAFFAAVLSWFVTSFEPLYAWLELPASLSPFTWYTMANPLTDAWSTGFWWLILMTVLLGFATVWLFSRRDISTELAVLPDLPKVKRRATNIKVRSSWLLGSVMTKTVWDRRRSVFAWAGGIAALLLVTFAAWPALSKDSDALADLVSSLPSELFAIFGLTNPEALTTPAGFISSRAYLNIGPMIMIIFWVGGISTLVAKEERSGALDMVLSAPLSRRSVLLQKVLGLVALAGVITILLIAASFVGNALYDTDLEPLNIVGANVGLMLLGLFFGGLMLLLWSLLGSGGAAAGVTSAIAVVSFFLNGLAVVVEPIEPLRRLSPFFWYLGDVPPLAKGLVPGYLALLVGGVIGIAIALWRFQTRDLAT